MRLGGALVESYAIGLQNAMPLPKCDQKSKIRVELWT